MTAHVYSGARTPRLNRVVMWLVRRGISPMGAQILTVRGRSSGLPRRAPVNPLTIDGTTYLVAPRGHVAWTHNLRSHGEAELRIGRRSRHYHATELPVADRPEVLRPYLARWKREVGQYFAGDGITEHSTTQEWRAVAHHYPVFRLAPVDTPAD